MKEIGYKHMPCPPEQTTVCVTWQSCENSGMYLQQIS